MKHKWEEEFSVKDLRGLLGVPEDKLLRMPDLLRNCVNVAEVNGMADFKVKIDPVRKGGGIRGNVTGFRVSWCEKSAQEMQEAYQEIKRTKIGRIARLTGKVEKLEPARPRLPSPADHAELDARLAKMREAAE